VTDPFRPRPTVPPLVPNVYDELTARVVETLVADMETLALDMILKGMYPTQGWSIGVQWDGDRCSIHYRIFPVPPGPPGRHSQFPADLI